MVKKGQVAVNETKLKLGYEKLLSTTIYNVVMFNFSFVEDIRGKIKVSFLISAAAMILNNL